ncbi:ABC transporter [Musa troglodytarum]|uniref:ABC transporter n=1 Tax=Musa troglodytarum TaxID=320322 RepID=A0A9E7EB93_9LILI|nr:ABC transporter [Musa troglodytarum]
MLINPSLLFLDEPTSGLDSIAGRIVSTLADLTKGDGNPVYYDRGSEVMVYFASIDYSPAMPMNLADFLLDLPNDISVNETVKGTTSTKEALLDTYYHHLCGKLTEELLGLSQQLELQQHEAEKMTNQWCTTWWQQFMVLLQGGLKER